MTELESALAKIMHTAPNPRRVPAFAPITDEQAAQARRYIASGRPTVTPVGTIYTHGKEG